MKFEVEREIRGWMITGENYRAKERFAYVFVSI